MLFTTEELVILETIATVTKFAHRTFWLTVLVVCECILDLMQAAWDSGVIARQWWENRGRDYAVAVVLVLTMAAIAIATLTCYVVVLASRIPSFLTLDGRCPNWGQCPDWDLACDVETDLKGARLLSWALELAH